MYFCDSATIFICHDVTYTSEIKGRVQTWWQVFVTMSQQFKTSFFFMVTIYQVPLKKLKKWHGDIMSPCHDVTTSPPNLRNSLTITGLRHFWVWICVVVISHDVAGYATPDSRKSRLPKKKKTEKKLHFTHRTYH